MLQAKSTYKGGELISADAADYPDTVDLGLTCPFCGKPVFLVKEATRLRRGKTEYIRPHFNHYKAEDESGKICEARALSKEGREFLTQLSPESRGQRLRLFNKRLWQMLSWQKDFPKNLDKWLRKKTPSTHYNLIPEMIKHCHQQWQNPMERQKIKDFLPQSVEVLDEDTVRKATSSANLDRVCVQRVISAVKEDLDNRLQWAIAEEVVDYLAQKEAKNVFANLVLLAMYDAVPTAVANRQVVSSNDVQELIIYSIGLTDWCRAVEYFKTARPGEGFLR